MNTVVWRSAALLASTLVAAGLAACGSGGGTSSAHAPVHIVVDATLTGGISFPQSVYGAKAAAADLNKSGGIDGHKVIIVPCDNKNDPNGGADCARTAVQNKDLAIAGSFDLGGAAGAFPLLQQAKIPFVGGVSTAIQELSSPISFQTDGGVDVGEFATVLQTKQSGCHHVVDFSPGGRSAVLDPQLEAAYRKAGITFTKVVAPAGTADMSPYVSQALAAHPDCIMAEGPGPDTTRIIAAIREGGSKVKIFTSTGALAPQLVASQGKLADGVYANSTTLLGNSTDPLVTQTRKDMVALMGPKAGVMNLDEFSQDSWAAVMLINEALKGAKQVDGPTLLAALDKMTHATAGSVHNPINFTATRDSKLFPRLFNTWVRYFVVKNGVYTNVDTTWHNANAYIP